MNLKISQSLSFEIIKFNFNLNYYFLLKLFLMSATIKNEKVEFRRKVQVHEEFFGDNE